MISITVTVLNKIIMEWIRCPPILTSSLFFFLDRLGAKSTARQRQQINSSNYKLYEATYPRARKFYFRSTECITYTYTTNSEQQDNPSQKCLKPNNPQIIEAYAKSLLLVFIQAIIKIEMNVLMETEEIGRRNRATPKTETDCQQQQQQQQLLKSQLMMKRAHGKRTNTHSVVMKCRDKGPMGKYYKFRSFNTNLFRL